MSKDYIDGLVSIIVPVYNAEKYIEETLESIFSQTYKNFEVMIVDDMSSDGSKDIINRYAQKYDNIRPIFLEKNAGVANARNVGIANARGRFIAFLDSDDIWMSDKLEKQVSFMTKNNYPFSFTTYRFIDMDSNEMNTVVHAKKMLTYNDLLKHNAISCLTVIIDRYQVRDIVMPSIRHEDYACWLKILKKGYNAYGLDELLAKYRTRKNSLSGNKIKAATWTWNILRREEGLNIFKACYCFLYYAVVNVFKHILSK